MKFLINLEFNPIKKAKLYPVLLIIGLFFFLPNAEAQNAFELLKSTFENDSVFTASFEHEYRDTFTGENQRTEGRIWIGKTHYKIISGDNIMVVDGEISRVYDSVKNRVIVSEYVEEEDDFAPSRMLQGADEHYRPVVEAVDDGGTLVRLSSEDPFSIFNTVEIYLDQSEIPERIIAVDQVENELVTHFYEGRFLPLSANLFRFPIPEGAEEIDLRHGSP